jgi:hypothetical protein
MIDRSILTLQTSNALNIGDDVFTEESPTPAVGKVISKGPVGNVSIKFADGNTRSILPAMTGVYLIRDIKRLLEMYQQR